VESVLDVTLVGASAHHLKIRLKADRTYRQFKEQHTNKEEFIAHRHFEYCFIQLWEDDILRRKEE